MNDGKDDMNDDGFPIIDDELFNPDNGIMPPIPEEKKYSQMTGESSYHISSGCGSDKKLSYSNQFQSVTTPTTFPVNGDAEIS